VDQLIYNQQQAPRMTHTRIRSAVQAVLLVMLSLGLVSSTPSQSDAKRSTGARKSKKSAHSASYKVSKKRSAKLSQRHRAPKRTLTASEKLAMIEQVKNLATSQLIEDAETAPEMDESSVAMTPELEAELARAAKEEMEEDDIEVSIERFFREKQGTMESLDPEVIKERQTDFTLFDESDPTTAATRSDVMAQIIDWMGTRYIFGGMSRGGIDCSAFTREVYRKSFGLELPRTAQMQSALGEQVKQHELKFGDLVFFHTANYAPVSHVGIYIGEGLFANAASSKGVSVASLKSAYWSKRYIGAKRLLSNSIYAGRTAESNPLRAERSLD
jgi:cell wall-associated NlpC family hydrolase